MAEDDDERIDAQREVELPNQDDLPQNFMQDDGSAGPIYFHADGSQHADVDAVSKETPKLSDMGRPLWSDELSEEEAEREARSPPTLGPPAPGFRRLKVVEDADSSSDDEPDPQEARSPPTPAPVQQIDAKQAARVLTVAEDMKVVRKFIDTKVDIAEAYSPLVSQQRRPRWVWSEDSR